MMKVSPRGIVRRSLVILLCLSLVTLPAAKASDTEALRAETLDSQTLRLSWELPSADNGMFSVSLCQEDTQRCWLAGSTAAHTFLLNSLQPGVRYSVHVNGASGAQAAVTVTMPGEKTNADPQGTPGLGALGGAQPKSSVSDASVRLLDAASVAITWAEAGSGSYTYTVTLCEADASLCRLLGTTGETTFAIDGLTAGDAYTAHIGASGGNAIACDFIMPVTKDQ